MVELTEKVALFANSTIFEKYTVNPLGQKHGEYIRYSPESYLTDSEPVPVLCCNYTNGELHGLYTKYHLDCKTLSIRCNYSNDKLHGKYESWTTEGYPFISAEYTNGVRNGEYQEWDLKTHVLVKQMFFEQVPDGKIVPTENSKTWYPTSQLKSHRTSVSEKRYTKSGSVFQEVFFSDQLRWFPERILWYTHSEQTLECVYSTSTRKIQFMTEWNHDRSYKIIEYLPNDQHHTRRYDKHGQEIKSCISRFINWITNMLDQPETYEYELVPFSDIASSESKSANKED